MVRASPLLDPWKATIDGWWPMMRERRRSSATPLEGSISAKSRVSVRQCFYSVPASFVGRRIDVYLGDEHFEAREQGRVVARHERAVGKGTERLCLDHYLEVLDYKPGALAGATALGAARASGSFTDVHERFWTAARRKPAHRGVNAETVSLLASCSYLDRGEPVVADWPD